MGRPINKKYFGNTNAGSTSTSADNGIGGEGISAISISNSGTNYSQGVTATVSAPQLPGGVRALVTPIIPATGALAGQVTGFSITERGSGYTSATVSLNLAATVTGRTGDAVSGASTLTNVTSVAGIYVGMLVGGNFAMQASTYVTALSTNTVTLSKTLTATTASVILSFTSAGASFASSVSLQNVRSNAIDFLAWVPTATNGTLNTGGSAVLGDIVKQQGTKRYYVKTSQGYGVCALTTGTVTRGTMTIIGSDWNGNTYWVTRLESRKARVWRKTQSGSNAWVYATGDLARWSFNAATGTVKTVVGTSIQIPSV
jgi:hypothetical protein